MVYSLGKLYFSFHKHLKSIDDIFYRKQRREEWIGGAGWEYKGKSQHSSRSAFEG